MRGFGWQHIVIFLEFVAASFVLTFAGIGVSHWQWWFVMLALLVVELATASWALKP